MAHLSTLHFQKKKRNRLQKWGIKIKKHGRNIKERSDGRSCSPCTQGLGYYFCEVEDGFLCDTRGRLDELVLDSPAEALFVPGTGAVLELARDCLFCPGGSIFEGAVVVFGTLLLTVPRVPDLEAKAEPLAACE